MAIAVFCAARVEFGGQEADLPQGRARIRAERHETSLLLKRQYYDALLSRLGSAVSSTGTEDRSGQKIVWIRVLGELSQTSLLSQM